ncbi:MAG: hypothetical protein KBG48_07720 [Kofleriaceae bacterium]|jgi:hypothetical protein|nr:hypothetical protein [Kofleriaceae bacterium]MBP9167257.1 hypothetical protein [Kofleriaceae bacterium]MBP9860742.1 hypothetical protein [Kofleriaceae bacterium]
MEAHDETDTPADAPKTPGTARYGELKALVASMEADFNKFFNDGNKAAGTRVRAAMQQLKAFAQAVRTEVQNVKNEGKS